MSVPLIQKVKIRLRTAGVELDRTVKWQVTKTHASPEGFHFTCDNPLILQRMAEESSRMALDLDFLPPPSFEPWRQCSVGFTEIGEGSRVHLDVGIGQSRQCRVFIDPDSHVVGRDEWGNALREFKGPIVNRVMAAAARKQIHLENFGCRAIRVYSNGAEPPGFDFRCQGNGMQRLLTHVQSLAKFKFDDPDDKLHGGWFNQVATHGSGFREKGYGPRLHIEISLRDNLGNVHIDSHAFVREDGTYDWHEGFTQHGPHDLISGPLGGHIGRVNILPFGSIVYSRDPAHETTVIGLPDGRVAAPPDGGPDNSGRGWRLTLGARLTF